MKIILFLLILSASTVASGDTVKKWTDEKGKVHYGDKKAAEYVEGTETLKIKDTYNQQSYDEGTQRHKETKKFADSLEKDRLKEEEKKREMEEKESSKTSAPAAGGTSVVPGRARPLQRNIRHPGNGGSERPVNLPAKRK
jgi:phage/plasmid-associated DNA primase